jgi:hypothetical protein
MGWISTLLASGEASDETAINGVPYDAHKAIPIRAEKPAAPRDGPDAQIAEEIKRRQIALAVSYVAKVRAR